MKASKTRKIAAVRCKAINQARTAVVRHAAKLAAGYVYRGPTAFVEAFHATQRAAK